MTVFSSGSPSPANPAGPAGPAASKASARRLVYPFTALVGQERMRTALVLNAVCPAIGGVLVRGQKGTAKSTAVRGLAALLPEIEVVGGCAFGCDPDGVLCDACRARADAGERLPRARRVTRVVDMPLGATEDRVAGTLDLEHAVRLGRRVLQPGLLALAHRAILYVDEVNLLHDHIVDLVLDAAATGINVVEREGVSAAHPAAFILVGTMNPEEGELRPQLLDRFGLCVEVAAPTDVDTRMEVVRLRDAFERDPVAFARHWEPEQERLRAAIVQARRILPLVRMPEDLQRKGCELCLEANVAGHRADVTLRRAARALAALADRQEVRLEDVLLAAELVLASRARPAPPPPPEQDEPEPDEEHEHEEQQEQDESEEEQPQEEHPEDERPREEQRGQGAEPEEREAEERDEPQENEGEEQAPPRAARETVFDVGEPFRVRDVPLARDRVPRTGPGKRTRSRTPLKAGRYVRSRRDPKPSDLALDATLRAAAPHQRARAGTHPGLALAVETGDLMRKVREKRVGSCIVLAVDASGSMGAARRMVEAKGAVLSLLLDAYQKRDTVAFVAFRGQEAELLLPPTGSVELAYRHLEELPTGGRTPLSDGLSMAYQVLDARLRKDPATFPVLVLVSDGRANVASFGGKPLAEAMEVADAVREDGRIRAVVVDVEKPGLVSFGLAGELAARMGARCYKVEELRADTLVRVLREEILPE